MKRCNDYGISFRSHLTGILKYGIFLLGVWLFAGTEFAIHAQQVMGRYVQERTRTDRLETLSELFEAEYIQEYRKALEWARERNVPVTDTLDDGSFIELQRLDEWGRPVYYQTLNLDAAATVGTDLVWPNGGMGLMLSGSGLTVGLWDGGAVRATHQELQGKINQADGAEELSAHATHVAGTLVAEGLRSQARGMARLARVKAHDWGNARSEMSSAAGQGLLSSNHSYGTVTGWSKKDNQWRWHGNLDISSREDFRFGYYGYQSASWDEIAYNAPYYLIVKSAGNDRNDSGPGEGEDWYINQDGDWVTAQGEPPQPDGPYDCLPAKSVAKNILTLGAVHDIAGGYGQPTDVQISGFSSWGPADDGRIKPDLVANGTGLYSSHSDGDAVYDRFSGTSMSAPNTTGSLILLQEHYMNHHRGLPMRAATLKALVLHTAHEAGQAPGPDYTHGWGLLNTDGAAEVISDDSIRHLIQENTISRGEENAFEIYTDGTTSLKATVVWTDPAGSPPVQTVDNRQTVLTNNLGLRIVGDDSTYFPWKLDPANPRAPATRGDNDVDNVQRVDLEYPTPGLYRIVINADGPITDGPQHYSLIVSGISRFEIPLYELTLTIGDSAANRRLHLGESRSGSSGYDRGLDLLASSPQPGEFNAHLEHEDRNYIRDIRGATVTEKVFQIHYTAPAGSSYALTWDPAGLDTLNRVLTLQDSLIHAAWQVNMADTSRREFTVPPSGSDSLYVTVTPGGKNRPPELAGMIPDQEIPFNMHGHTVADLDSVFHEPDGESLLYSVQLDSPFSARIRGSLLELDATAGKAGTTMVRITASDGAGSVADSFMARVSSEAGFQIPVTVTGGTESRTLRLGQIAGATGGFDRGIDEAAPPGEFEDGFTARLFWKEESYLTDMRDTTAAGKVFDVRYTMGEYDSVKISWDPELLRKTRYTFQLVDPQLGTLFQEDMTLVDHIWTSQSPLLSERANIQIAPREGNRRPEVLQSPGTVPAPINAIEYPVADLDTVFTDPDDQPLQYTVRTRDRIIATVEDDRLHLTIPAEFRGTSPVVVYASDGTLANRDTVRVNVSERTGFQLVVAVLDGMNQQRLILGQAPRGTPGIDSTLDVYARQLPPEGYFYSRIVTPDTALIKDIRDTTGSLQRFPIRYAPESGRTITLRWDPEVLAATDREFFLSDTLGGQNRLVDMTAVSEVRADSNSHLLGGATVNVHRPVTETESPSVASVPKQYKLLQNYPNPFNPVTTIRYGLPSESKVILKIYDIRGRKVVTLVNGVHEAGWHTFRWDGTNSAGRIVGSGIYFYQIQTAEFINTKKMLFLK